MQSRSSRLLQLMPFVAAMVILLGGGYGLLFVPADQLAMGWLSKAFFAVLMPFGLLFLAMGWGFWRK